MVAEHERGVKKYDNATNDYQEKVCVALRKALTAAESGRLPGHESGYRETYLKVLVRFNVPVKPELRTDQIDRLITTLEMASDPTLVISAEDAAQYLG
jgi:hypothetical protein